MTKNTEKKNNAIEVKPEVIEAQTIFSAPMVNNNLMTQDDLGSYYSWKPKTKAEQIALFNAINNPDKRIGDCINETIEIKHILVERVEIEEDDGGQALCPRIIVVDKDGVSYVAVSFGIMNGLKRIIKFFGEPETWETPLKVKVKQVTKGERKILTMELV